MDKAKLVAKRNFDDGSNRHKDTGKGMEYKAGDVYKGSKSEADAAMKKGLICTPAELKAEGALNASLSKSIEDLRKENMDLRKALDAAEKTNQDLQEELDGIEFEDDEPGKKGKNK